MKTKRASRISEHAEGIGTVTAGMIEQRARELALIEGRSVEEVTKSDRLKARSELLHGKPRPVTEEVEISTQPWTRPLGSTGRKQRKKLPNDDRVTEQVVEEGVAEAGHDQMVTERKSRSRTSVHRRGK